MWEPLTQAEGAWKGWYCDVLDCGEISQWVVDLLDLALHSHGELVDLEKAVVGMQPISDLSWERWEKSLDWVNEKTNY